MTTRAPVDADSASFPIDTFVSTHPSSLRPSLALFLSLSLLPFPFPFSFAPLSLSLFLYHSVPPTVFNPCYLPLSAGKQLEATLYSVHRGRLQCTNGDDKDDGTEW